MLMMLRRIEGADDLSEAVRKIPDDPPSVTKARALATYAEAVFKIEGTGADARAAAEAAVQMARKVGDGVSEADAQLTLFCLAADYSDNRLRMLEDVLRLAEASGSFRPVLRLAINKSHHLEGAGRHEDAATVSRAGIARAREYGLERTTGTFLAINLVEPLTSLGRWDEAIQVIEQALEQDPPIGHQAALREFAGEIAALRGEFGTAEACRDFSKAFVEVDPRFRVEDTFAVIRLEATIELVRGRPDLVFPIIEPVLRARDLFDEARFSWPVLVLGAEACLALPGSPEAARTLERLRERAPRLAVSGPVQAAHRRTFEAVLARIAGAKDLRAWDDVAAAWSALGQPYSHAKALFAAGEIAFATGDREGAADRLRLATELAEKLRAQPLLDRIADFSRRARLAPGGQSSAHGLTPRELEVLRLVAEGRSNREIADALFISTKTASVHVSNILAKLGVTGRGEAAATAHRLALFP
jgi:DNA-binding CsgD family transcriptional regulator